MGEKVPLVARAVGGRFLGPRPGRAIITFWQGNVEIIMRVAIAIISLCALIPAAVALTQGHNASEEKVEERMGASGLVVAVATVALVVELALVVLRFVNIGVVNYKIRLFLIADAVVSCALAVLFLGATAASGYAAHQWRSVKDGHTIYVALAAASAFSCVAMLCAGFLGVWSFLFMVNKWNKKVIVHTLKDAVLG